MHPENRKRLEACGRLQQTDIEDGEAFLPLVHKKFYIDQVKKACEMGSRLDQDTVVSSGTYEAAIKAVGATIMASKTGDFALVRPPGHHAHQDRSSGFCIFNNVAIAAQKLVDEGKRVMIFDFDGHLGDGTFKFFYKTNKVLYWSLHQFPAFPGGGTPDQIGEDEGAGYTIPVPLPPGAGDDLFMDAMKRFMPVAEQFAPDVVAVSAGFDAHKDDLLLDLRASTNLFYHMGQILKDKFKNIFATLEGGYNIMTFPKCLFNFIDGINGDEMKHEETKTDSHILAYEEYEGNAVMLERNLSKYWKI
ncbi:acetylpolyamine amidohydrolase [Candidatus Woesearchaeota archaeon CG11_big_fil_rev_8_21_14_0_20_43_8]|nr:MAG: acetylpolyamine amidohydrolase [Candidatus Woesearchaeota archaeon CG11_big_fil_rev_8_21_14_0_20_43_8]PIO04618.1 MAG: acetylpolyamine amidohydrolase [Candidatus Woesearchaeota archaeon CG08_land_8_20_14_0_20_43_7]